MKDLFDLIQGSTRLAPRGEERVLKPKSKLAGYALKQAMGGGDLLDQTGLESSWFDVDHHLAARSAEADDDFRGSGNAGEVENEELEGTLRTLSNFEDEF